jgi:hypothetical protein
MKATSTFSMSKETKRVLATLDGQYKADYKSLMIKAQLASEQAKRETFKQSRSSGEE